MKSLLHSLRRTCGPVVASLLVSGATAGAQAPPQQTAAPAPTSTSATTPARDTLLGVRTGFSFGVRLGTSVAKLVSKQEATTQGRIAPAAGIYTEARWGRWLSLVVDVMYNEYGGNGVNPVPMYGKDSL